MIEKSESAYIQLEVESEELGISLHAMTGSNSPRTMRLKGRINH